MAVSISSVPFLDFYGCMGLLTLAMLAFLRCKCRNDLWRWLAYCSDIGLLLFLALWPIILPILVWMVVRRWRALASRKREM